MGAIRESVLKAKEKDLEDKVWVREYLETIFSSKEKPSPAIIWDKVSKFSGKLYKYYSFEDEYAIENLKNGVIHFSKPERFNDPFDCAVSISLNKIIEAYLPMLIDVNMSIGGENEELIKDCIKHILFDSQTEMQTDVKELRLVKLLITAPAFQKLMPKMVKGETISDTEVQQAVITSFLDTNFASQFMGLIGNIDSSVDFTKLPLNDLYSDIISAIAQNPDMLSSIGANVSKENISTLKQLNDVMKASSLIEKLEKVSYIGGFDGGKIKADLENARTKLIPLTERLKEIVNNQFAISCFSKLSDSILMWSHYGNKHTGFCVEYNFEKCRNLDVLINLFPVLYSVERPSLPMGLFDFSNPQQVKLNNVSDYTPELTMLLLSKSSEWDYEQEWRIVNPQSQLIDGHLLDLHTISHIYLGANISKENECLIRDVAKKLTIPISKYRISPDKYQLEIEY